MQDGGGRIKEAYEHREGHIKIAKCYSHLDAKTAIELEQPLLWTLGNEMADTMAQYHFATFFSS